MYLEVERKVVIEKNKEIEVFENKKTITDKIIRNLHTLRSKIKEKSEMIPREEDCIQELVTQITEFQTKIFLNKRKIEEAENEKELFNNELY